MYAKQSTSKYKLPQLVSYDYFSESGWFIMVHPWKVIPSIDLYLMLKAKL